MAKQHILVRRIPPVLGLDWQMYARNLSTGQVKMIEFPMEGDPELVAVGAIAPGVWVDPGFRWAEHNGRVYTIEV